MSPVRLPTPVYLLTCNPLKTLSLLGYLPRLCTVVPVVCKILKIYSFLHLPRLCTQPPHTPLALERALGRALGKLLRELVSDGALTAHHVCAVTLTP